MFDIRRLVRLGLLAALAAGLACDDGPLEPVTDDTETEPEVETVDPSDVPTADRTGFISDRARLIDPARTRLTSTEAQLEEGEYRFTQAGGIGDSIRRNDVVVVNVDGEPRPRRVVSAEEADGELILDTGPALWSDVVNSGEYSVRMPIAGATAADVSLPGLDVDQDIDVPPLGTTFDLDLCAHVDSLLANLPDSPTLCGSEKDMSKTVAMVNVTLAGTIDSLALLDGDIQVSGSMSLDLLVDGGGVTGGSPPVFYPCRAGAYPGCLTTPTGAALIEWLRTYAPNIPEASLPPVRVCIPGTKVRTRPGHWDYSGFIPVWVPGTWVTCRITDTGELPTVVPPSVQQVNSVIQPRVRGGMTMYVQGDGRLGLKVPIPSIGYQGAFRPIPRVDVSGSIGVFASVNLTIKNTAAAVRTDFDEEVRVTQSWNPSDGWGSNTESIRSEQSAELVELTNPDSVVLRLGVPIEARATLSLVSDTSSSSGSGAAPVAAGPAGLVASDPGASGPSEAGAAVGGVTAAASTDSINILDWLDLGAHAGLTIAPINELIWSREQVDPNDPEIDNWHLSDDQLYELTPGAGIDIPEIFFEPPVPLSWDSTFEFGRLSYTDLWGTGHLRVETTTTGTDPDPDGYTAVVSRSDDKPYVVDEGATRVPEFDWISALTEPVGPDAAVVFGTPGACDVVYSDVLLSVVSPVAIEGVRAAGVNVPKYAAVTPQCDVLLIGRHTVELTGVSENCTVQGGAVRDSVWLLQRRRGLDPRSDTTVVNFDVDCVSAGSLGAVKVRADMPDVTDAPLDVLVDGEARAVVAAGDSVTVSGLVAGTRSIDLGGLPTYCALDPVDVNVVGSATVDTTLAPSCDVPVDVLEAGEVKVTLTATGAGDAPDAFLVTLDGVLRAGASPGSDAILTDLPASTPSALLLTQPATRCRVNTLNPLIVELNASRDPESVDFTTECTASAIDTLDGGVTTSTVPVPAAWIEDGDGGESLRLTGPLADDFLQLAGTNVRVRGVRAGTSLDVYGYEVRSSLGEPRWIGLVIERDGKLWLFGEDAIELVDAPPGLASQVGALVWVGGDEIGLSPTQVVPRVYGVIREATP